ncbi:hypothetical protein J1614_006596 [Plenodomus biglobosus]|nr:hypothetical protein J1614_006596 [Plenodomus biglobosus]
MGISLITRCMRSLQLHPRQTVATQKASTVSSRRLPDLKYGDEIFSFTRGRFLCDEEYEVSQRNVEFNVNELAQCAADAVGAKTCTSITKYPDGLYNKSMLLTMDNGYQVVAKVPNPNAGIPHYTTASEVATMEFAKTILGTPVPKVLAWSSRAQESRVGAEYIIMEKASGVELEHFWPTMNIEDRLTVVKAIAGFQKAWTSISFEKYGSLYYSKDLERTVADEYLYTDADGNRIANTSFAIGPCTGREMTDNRRDSIDFDRGPWSSLADYHTAIGKRELACVKQLPSLPKSPITLCGPGTYVPTRDKKVKALRSYLSLIKFLLPKDEAISPAHIWHGDLHVANIFVDSNEPTKVVGLIDWQSTEIAPLYFQARQPHIIDYNGPPVIGLERPKRPENMESLTDSAKRAADEMYLRQSLCSLYNTLTYHQNPRLYAALEFQHTISYLLLLLARNMLVDGEATYLLQVAELEAIWDTLPGADGTPYPFSFTLKERQEMETDVDGAARGMEAMRSIKDALGELFPEQGIVRPEQYDEALDALAQMKDQVIAEFTQDEQERELWQQLWLFGT